MLVVVALDGNAPMSRSEPANAETQARNIAIAAQAIASIAEQHDVVVTHGNGPQIGLLALQASTNSDDPIFSLEVLGAETEGMIGYVIERELSGLLPSRSIATLLTQVEVDPGDPAFSDPAKPIDPLYTEADARRLATERGWKIVKDGTGYRRAVPSPVPLAIREFEAIEILVDAGLVVIRAGGGGIPISIDENGRIRGVEAVIDKDHCAALLAIDLNADALLILTEVPAVYDGRGTPNQRAIRHATPQALARFTFERGTMGPKAEAACRFVTATGGIAGIGDLASAGALLRDEAGTVIRCGDGCIVT